MRWSRMFIPTLRENPADAEFPSHQLLIRGGFVRQLTAGIYSFLPLGQRTMLKIAGIVREEMNAAGAQEFLLPALHPADLCRETEGWSDSGASPFRLKDHGGRSLCLGMTYEDVFTDIARKEIRSYKDLPQIWYQIHLKFRDEPRPRSGLIRLRQFFAKDSCSFDVDWEGLDKSYRLYRDVYCRIFKRCGLSFVIAEASAGTADGSRSEEFLVRTGAGEGFAVSCKCGYAANLDRATSSILKPVDTPSSGPPTEVHTPGQKTIAAIADFLRVPATHQIKSLVYIVNGSPILFLVRGDHQLNESKVIAATGSGAVRPAEPAEIRDAFGADAGSLGPIGVRDLPIYADLELRGRQNLTCGSNRNDYHLQGVTPDVDFKPLWADLRTVGEGESCTRCGKPLEIYKTLEIGHLIKTGAGHSEAMGAMVLNAEGKQIPIAMGRYGIGLERIMSSAIELYHDNDGICWPVSIAPFSVVLTAVNYKDAVMEAADRLYADFQAAGIDVLLDDRQERPGVKFKDADLIGIPYRVVVGEKARQGLVELVDRATKQKRLVDIASVVPALKTEIDSQLAI